MLIVMTKRVTYVIITNMIDRPTIDVSNPEFIRSPEISMGLQTYEYFTGGRERPELIERFINGEATELSLDYPKLSLSEIDDHVSNLTSLISEDNTGSASVEFRLAEAYMLKASQQINALDNPHQQIIDHFQEINESIYGKPDKVVVDQMLSRLWGQIESKRGGVADSLIDELKEGWVFTSANGEEVEIPALPNPVDTPQESLPTLSQEAIEWIYDELSKEYAPVKEVFEEYYQDKIEPREDKSITPADIVAMFKKGIQAIHLHEVNITEDQNATALSWSSANRSVVVGMKRKNFSSIDDILGVFVHEIGVHGRRYANGRDLGDDSLANGLFTEANNNEVPDYLTFEEGLAGTLQKIMQGDEEKWELASMALYLNVAFAHMGWTPRQVQEVMTKVRVVLGSSEEDGRIIDELIKKSKRTTATGVVRVFRGTPTEKHLNTSEGVALHYAKDLAYASGKIKAIPLLNKIALMSEPERSEAWSRLFIGKYDPTNSHHQQYVNRRRSYT